MVEMLRQYVQTNQTDWCSYLDLVMMAYRTSVHSSTGYTPFELNHGRQARLPTHLLAPDNGPVFQTEQDFVKQVQEKLMSAYDAARETNWRSTIRQKKYHDRTINPSSLEVGEKVYLLRPTPVQGLSPKLQPKFKGPFQLNVILGPNGLIGPSPPNRGKNVWVHLNHLRRMAPRKIPEFQWELSTGEIDPADLNATANAIPDACEVQDPDVPDASAEQEVSATSKTAAWSDVDADSSPVGNDDLDEDWTLPRKRYNLRSRQAKI